MGATSPGPLLRIASILGKAFLSLGFFLAILEIGIRLVAPVPRMAYLPVMWDPDVGVKHIPDSRGFITCSEYDMDLVINSRGLRDREHPLEKPPGTRRILCLGDSFTCGHGVAREETFAEVLERSLASAGDPAETWEVLNAGVGGTGTAHQLAYYRTEGHRYSPDVVVLCISPNDFWDNVTSGLYVLEGESLAKRTARRTSAADIQRISRRIPGLQSFLARSHLLNTVRHKFAMLHQQTLSARSVKGQDRAELERRTRELMRRLVRSLRTACEADGAALVAMIVPPLLDKGKGVDRMADVVEFLEREGFPTVDLRPSFASAAERGKITNYRGDGHWTPLGHELAARHLRETLVQVVEIQARGSASGLPSDRG